MQVLLSNFKFNINSNIFVKDPETSTLGRKIIQGSISLIYEVGFDSFTFRKLGEKINSNESSIYRYFENKQKLMLYLSSWYWSWIEYKLVFGTTNLTNPSEKLLKSIQIITEKVEDNASNFYINEVVLNKIIIVEFSKIFSLKEEEFDNNNDFFLIYKRIISRLEAIVKEIKPEYAFPKSLISMVIEGSLHQHFLSENHKTITNCNEKVSPLDFYSNLIDKVLLK